MDRRLKPRNFINKSLRQKKEVKVYVNDVDKAMVEYY